MSNMKRALMLMDVPNWAQANWARGIQKYAPAEYEVEIGIAAEYLKAMAPEYRASFDGVCAPLFAMYRRPGVRRLVGLLASHALMFPEYDAKNWQTLGVTKDRHRRHARKVLANVDGAIARNRELRFSLSEYHQNIVTIPAGVDLDIFHSRGRTYHIETDTKMRVGWCGNKHCKHDRNFKGYERILEPLMELTGSQYEWRINTNDHTNAVSPREMAAWYRECDVFLTTSSGEGTPNTSMEAAACGCCLISTDVGQITDWAAMRSMAQIVPTYRNESEAQATIRAFAALLDGFDEHRADMATTGAILAGDVKRHYDYKIIAPRVLEFVTHSTRK